jgi:hypothetical protein
MSADLIRAMRAERETWVDVGAHGYQVRRPLALWLAAWRRDGADEVALLRAVLVGWRGITEADLVRSGGPDAVPFDGDLAIEYLGDRAADVEAIVAALFKSLDARKAALEDAAKN